MSRNPGEDADYIESQYLPFDSQSEDDYWAAMDAQNAADRAAREAQR